MKYRIEQVHSCKYIVWIKKIFRPWKRLYIYGDPLTAIDREKHSEFSTYFCSLELAMSELERYVRLTEMHKQRKVKRYVKSGVIDKTFTFTSLLQ